MASLITFRAGRCDFQGRSVKPIPTPGYIYLYIEDDIMHFSWRERSKPTDDPELDLIMFPGDCTFLPYLDTKTNNSNEKTSPTNGRIFELKFSSSSQRHYFWLQSKSQHKDGKTNWFSKQDLLIGNTVDKILAGEEPDWQQQLESLRRGDGGGNDDDAAPGRDDDVMEDVQDEQSDLQRQTSGGAGADATGGDPRQEGEDSRRGGEDGGRANTTTETSTLVQNFLQSLTGSNLKSQGSGAQPSYDKPFASLANLFDTNTTVPFLASASSEQVDALCLQLPPSIFLLAQENTESLAATEPTAEAGKAAVEALSDGQKRDILQRVLRSPQLHQFLESLTNALKEGGLPALGEALMFDVENGGKIIGGNVPIGGTEAVKRFLEGAKRTVERDAK